MVFCEECQKQISPKNIAKHRATRIHIKNKQLNELNKIIVNNNNIKK